MLRGSKFQYTNPLSADPLQGFKDCLTEFSHRRASCPTDPFASPLVSPEVSDSSGNSRFLNPEDFPPLSPRSQLLTTGVKANQVIALQEGGKQRRPRVYRVKCHESRGWVLQLEENVSVLDPACQFVVVKKDGRFGLRSGLAQGRLLRSNPQLELTFVRGVLESWETWSIRGESPVDCVLRNERFKKELNVTLVTIGEVVDSAGNVRLTHDAVLAAEALAYPGPYVSSSTRKSTQRGGQSGAKSEGGSVAAIKKQTGGSSNRGDMSNGKAEGSTGLNGRDLGMELEAAREGSIDGAQSALRQSDGEEFDAARASRMLGRLVSARTDLEGKLAALERGDRIRRRSSDKSDGVQSSGSVHSALQKRGSAVEEGGREFLDSLDGGDDRSRPVSDGAGHNMEGTGFGRSFSSTGRSFDEIGGGVNGIRRNFNGPGRNANGSGTRSDGWERQRDGSGRQADGNGLDADGNRGNAAEADALRSDAGSPDASEVGADVLVKNALLEGPVRRGGSEEGRDGLTRTGRETDLREGASEDAASGRSRPQADEVHRLTQENQRLQQELSLEVEAAAFQRADLLRQLERERHRAEQLERELQQAGSARSTPSSARRRLAFPEDWNLAASVAERVECQLAAAVAKLNGSKEAPAVQTESTVRRTDQGAAPPGLLGRLRIVTRVMFGTSRVILPWLIVFGFGIWMARLKAKLTPSLYTGELMGNALP